MPTARLIVCEKTGHWAAVLRRALAGPAARVAETRSLAECYRQLALAPASVVAVQTTATNLETVVNSLVRWSAEFPRARFLVLTSRGFEAAEPLLREAGALDVLLRASDVAPAAELVARHLALAPPEDVSWRAAIQNRLPWPPQTAAAG